MWNDEKGKGSSRKDETVLEKVGQNGSKLRQQVHLRAQVEAVG